MPGIGEIGLRGGPSYDLQIEIREQASKKKLDGNSVWHSSRIVCDQEVQRLKESTTPPICGDGARVIAVLERSFPARPVKRTPVVVSLLNGARPTYSLAVALR